MIYFTRHGQTETNVKGIFNVSDVGLTTQGVEQAHEIARKAAEIGIIKIISSPLKRAKQTTEIVAADLGIDLDNIKFDPNLVERNVGVLLGKPNNGMTTATIPEDTEGAETKQAVFARAKQLLADYLKSSDPTLLIGHAGIYRFLVVALRDGDITEVQHVPRFTQGEITELTD